MVNGLNWETGIRKENKMTKPILKLRNINKAFSGVEVLHNISIDIKQGEVLGVLGENGAGKSTLLKIISGIYTASSGEVYIDDQRVDIQTPVHAKALGIAMIPQEFNLVEPLNVFENIFLGIELKNTALLDKKSMRGKTREILNSLETDLQPDTLIEDLSVAEKQMVEIAKALAYDSRILIMDEPTTVLTATEVDMLFRLVEKLKQRGVTILFISHKLKEVKQLCDRLAILRDGYLVSIDDVRKIDEHTMARKMVGRELNQIFPDKIIAPANTTLEVNHLYDGHFLEDISFKLNKGEVLGFAGLIGAGRT
jgi:ribose transport system ATP-binding protein